MSISVETFRGYAGYDQRNRPAENEELTHSGPGTPAGEYLRRYWHAIALSEELGGLPLVIRVLGEDLVLFRSRRGELGLLHRHCSHRGASLEYGRIDERGIRCCYHGWLYAPDGTLLEAPAEPREQSSVRQGASGCLSGSRVQRADLRLSGPRRHGAGVSHLRHLRDPRGRDGSLHVLVRLQLAAGDGERYRSSAFHVLAYPRQRPAVRRDLGRDGGYRVRGG